MSDSKTNVNVFVRLARPLLLVLGGILLLGVVLAAVGLWMPKTTLPDAALIRQLANSITTRLDAAVDALAALSPKLDKISGDVQRISDRLDGVEQDLASLQPKLVVIEQQQKDIRRELDEIKELIKALQKPPPSKEPGKRWPD